MKKLQIFSGLVLLTLIVPVLSLAKVEDKLQKNELAILRASTTENRLENRESILERIRERIASTTASSTGTSSEKRMEKLNDRLQKQQEKMEKVKDKLLNRETKVIEVLGQIADKINTRINILVGKGLNLTVAKAKLAEANAKITAATTEADNLSKLLTATTTDQLFTDIRTSEDKIRTLAKEAHTLLVDTIKEITKVLPKNGQATSTASTTD